MGSPDASIAALVGAALLAFAAPGDPLRLQYAGALALMCGLLFFVFWFFRLAFLANFLSRAVLVGFISGLGIEVFTNQVRKILGASVDRGIASRGRCPPDQGSHGQFDGYRGLLRGAAGPAGFDPACQPVLGGDRRECVADCPFDETVRPESAGGPGRPDPADDHCRRVQSPGQRGQCVGCDPVGPTFAQLSCRATGRLFAITPGAMAIVAITLCEGLLLVRQYSRKYGYKADGDQVLFAYGLANVAAGLTGALVSGNSPSRSAAMDSVGARSQLPSVVAAGTIALVMLFFTDTLAYLPNAALAGIVANAVLSLIEVGELRELYRLRRTEFGIAIVCLLSVLVLGPLKAVMIAFLLSTIDVIRRASQPGTWVLRESPDGSHFVPTETIGAPDESGLIVYRFGSPLYFANANRFMEEVEKLVTQGPTPIKAFVLDAEAMSDIDTTGAEVLHQVLALLANRGVTFAVARANPQLPPLFQRYHLLELIGENRLYPTNRHAVAALRQEQ